MKILIVHRLRSEFGGAHRYLLGLIDLLCSMNWEITLLIDLNPDLRELLGQISQKDVCIKEVNFDSLTAKRAGQALDKVLLDTAPDIVDFEAAAKTLRSAALNSAVLATCSASKVFTMHLPIITDQSDIRGSGRYIPLTSAWQGLTDRRSFIRLFDNGLSVSAHHAATLTKLLRIRTDFFTVIPNSVDTAVYRPARSKQDNCSKVRILSCGALTRRKRLDLLISAAAILRRHFKQFKVLIAGEGEDRSLLQRQIEDLSLDGVVTLIGHVKAISKFLQKGDIYVMCSDSEGFPYAVLEAMATGLPCVVSEVGDLPKMVRDSMEGYVIACRDDKAIAASLKQLIDDPNLRRRLGDAARERVVNHYSWTLSWARTQAFYTRIAP